MKVITIGPNQTEIETSTGYTVLYSYSTAVAVFVPGRGGLCTKERHSATTTRHIKAAIARWGCSRMEVSQDEINQLALKV